MKQGQKPAESRMEDVLASIRRAIDENAGAANGAGGMADFQIRFEAPANQSSHSRRRHEFTATGASGFAGILSGKKTIGEAAVTPVPAQRRPTAIVSHHRKDADGLHLAGEAAESVRPQPTPRIKPPSLRPPAESGRLAPSRQEGLISQAASEATLAAFDRLAETLMAQGQQTAGEAPQDILRGVLKEWLDEKLPNIVERLVRDEIERVVRRQR